MPTTDPAFSAPADGWEENASGTTAPASAPEPVAAVVDEARAVLASGRAFLASHSGWAEFDDRFDDNAPTTKGVRPSPTWTSSDDDDDASIAFPGLPSGDGGGSGPEKKKHDEAERLRRVLKVGGAALAVFVIASVALGAALGVVSSRDHADDAAAASSAAAEGTMGGKAGADPKPGASLFANATAPAPPVAAHTPTPTAAPSSNPTSHPSLRPSIEPTSHPSTTPTNAPIDPFYFGDLSILDENLGIEVSAGLSYRLVAMAGNKVAYANGDESDIDYHDAMDGAGIVPLEGGGYVYVSNAEVWDGDGGVYGLYFDAQGKVTEYKPLLEGTSGNCGGGLSPWRTWISCEEDKGGQCWQIDPDPSSPHHNNPKATNLGGNDGGTYESVAVDNRNPQRPIFFVTEDVEDGALRRVQVKGNGWEALHTEDAETSFLRIVNDTHFEWTADEDDGRETAEEYFPNAEGIAFHEDEGRLYFMSKATKTLIVLDVEDMTYEFETTGKKFYGDGSFTAEPDQGVLFGPTYRHMYFTEDGGSSPGVYARLGSTGAYYTMFQGLSSDYDGDETSGVALSPDRKRFYAAFQEAGLLFEFTRDDGLPFE